ncbi:unnamed protein product [Acanthoscelides obtectus]|uniref:Uncharacterized protein n=1 Tax=Acanthoscelides obtectus TaxID=200917 RepID=A0A9P0L5A3_ACAOB|nr:unnamed protein product [Acanthoscelides obtectus]CAH2011218.1 unnamed protein product [Acanthoscelides obtectus]CAK1679729.1 hypothetical protein AOBTE_LOCUS32422 [Acanthoscelides obtectus]CAK1679761.1 hypothetical protein AOBTE_LOCUS32429 [Acanthoscelides obtectus]
MHWCPKAIFSKIKFGRYLGISYLSPCLARPMIWRRKCQRQKRPAKSKRWDQNRSRKVPQRNTLNRRKQRRSNEILFQKVKVNDADNLYKTN